MASFKKIGKENWMFRWKYKDKITSKQHEAKRSGYRTRPEAVLGYEELKRKIDLGFDAVNGEKLVEFLTVWLKEYKEGKVAKNTYKLHQQNINLHITPYFQNIRLEDLTHDLYQKFINYLINDAYNKQKKKKGYSNRTVEIIHGTMYGAMQKALIRKKIQSNPCEDVTIFSTKELREKKKNKTNIKYISYEKIGEFLNTALIDNYYYYIFFRFLIETGMRKGEAAGLQWDNLDLESGRVYVTQTLDFQPDKDDELFGDTKTYHSERVIPIPNRLVLELRAHKVRQNDNKLRFKDTYHHDLNLVFCREDGTPLPKSTLFNAFRRILKKVDLPHMSIHTLRHTYAVLMLESGAEMKYIQEALGHGSMQITSDVYTHVSKKIESDSMDLFEKHTERIFKEGAEWGRKRNSQ